MVVDTRARASKRKRQRAAGGYSFWRLVFFSFENDKKRGKLLLFLTSVFSPLFLFSPSCLRLRPPLLINLSLSLFSQADYELNLYRRRGGQERVPSLASSLADAARWTSLGSASLTTNLISDASIGSLPAGLTLGERERIQLATPMSPALNMLASLGAPDRVLARDAEGKRLRRQALRGAVVVFVTAGYSGKKFIFEKAKDLGVRSIVLDGPDSWAQSLVGEGIIEKFVPVDFGDADAVFDRALSGVLAARAAIGGELDGVCTFCEMAVPLVSRLAERLGLPCNSPAAVDAARDKSSTRKVMEAACLPNPRSFLIEDASQIAEAAEHVGFPAVIKPIFGAASIGVVRVNSEEELVAAYKRVQKEMNSVKIVAGALQQGADEEDEAAAAAEEEAKKKAASTSTSAANGDGSAADAAAAANGSDASAAAPPASASTWIKTTLMVEEYLDGPEVDVDLVLSEGAPVYGSITDNWPTVEPYFNETGSNCPSVLPAEHQRELIDLAVRSVHALGLTLGVFHVELKQTSRGARLIEVNCRMGGGPVRATNLLVWGVDLVEEHLLTAAGIPSRPPVSPAPLKFIAEYSINAKKTGKIGAIDFLHKYESHPDVLYARPLVAVGEKVTAVEDGMPTWVSELMVEKPTVEEAIDFVQQIERETVVPVV